MMLLVSKHTGLEAAEVILEEGGDEQREVANELLHLRAAGLVDLSDVDVRRQELGDAGERAGGRWREDKKEIAKRNAVWSERER